VIIVPSLSHEFEPWQWSGYIPSWVDVSILLGSFGWFFMWFLLFLRYLPGLSIAEIKEVLPPPMKHEDPTEHMERVDGSGMYEVFATGYYEPTTSS
jgi:molybdopterin-containing oxidoreductase family membrane subunit